MSDYTIQKTVVVGAGTMGSGIAAQLANAGVDVYLLDIVPPNVISKDAEDRNIIAKGAIQRMLKAVPATDPLNAGFMIPENAQRITPGNTEDHLAEAVANADWIVEAALENIDLKRDLFAKLDNLKKPGAIISSNTSTIPLKEMVEGRSEEFKRHFLITHFFNPPRFMHLLELVKGEHTEQAVMDAIYEFGDVRMGKNVIFCKDTPAFLANRIGIYFMFRAINEAIEKNMKIEEADAVLGTPIGFPKEGIFGLLDLVGVGIVPLVTESLLKTLAPDDPFRQFDHEKGLTFINGLLAKGCLGRKSPNGGFYKMQKRADGKKQKYAVSLASGDYYEVQKPKLACVKAAKQHGPRAMFESDEPAACYSWAVVRDTLLYAAWLVPEISDDIADVDAALRGGYNAKWGPFEQIDQLDVDWFTDKILADGKPLPPVLKLAGHRPFYKIHNGKPSRLVFDFKNNTANYEELPAKPGILNLSDIKRSKKPLLSHHSAAVWDIGDGVACLSFQSKMNTLDPSILWVMNETIGFINENKSKYKALVIYNEGGNFSLGANLGLIAAGLSSPVAPAVYPMVESMVFHGQAVFRALREAPFPVVGAPNGMALGGGCELLLHCDAVQASAETYMGLVESGVGLIPAWGGCLRYLARCLESRDEAGIRRGPVPPVRQAFQTILMPQTAVSTSAFDAQKKLWLRKSDRVSMNPDHILADAKQLALNLAQNYTPPQPVIYRLPGPSARAALSMAIDDFYAKADATWHDVIVADALADTLTGGDTFAGKDITESDLAQLERENFLSLLKTPQTQKRIANTLKTGKPLREDPARLEGKSIDDIRAMRTVIRLPKREITGKPLQGNDAMQLRMLAELSAVLLRIFAR